MYYFAYGSNINPDRMRKRGVEFISRTFGILENYDLVFNKISNRNPKEGYANICPKEGSVVEGAIYKVSEEDIVKLDRKEGVPKHYLKYIMAVVNLKGKEIDAVVYIANNDRISLELLPTSDYLNNILKGKDIFTEKYYKYLQEINTLNE